MGHVGPPLRGKIGPLGPAWPMTKGPFRPNTDIFSFGDDSYQCHRKEQKSHSTPPLIHNFCSQLSMSNSYHLITISETDLIRTNLQQVYTFNDKITFFGTLVTSLQHVFA